MLANPLIEKPLIETPIPFKWNGRLPIVVEKEKRERERGGTKGVRREVVMGSHATGSSSSSLPLFLFELKPEELSFEFEILLPFPFSF